MAGFDGSRWIPLILILGCDETEAVSSTDAGPADATATEAKDGAPTDGTAPDAPGADASVSCPLDTASPNQDQSSAHVLSDGTINDLVVCVGHDDWFRLDLPYGQEMQLDVCTNATARLPAFEFFREEFPEPQYYLGGGNSGAGKVCVGTTVWQASGSYLFHVRTTELQLAYSVNLYLSPWYRQPCATEGAACDSTTVCTGGYCTCKADALEPNDSAAAARWIVSNVAYELVSCVADDDWMKIDAQAGSQLQIHLETSALVGDGYFVSLTVFDSPAAETPLAHYPKGTYSEDYSFSVPSTGTYFLRVQGTHSHGRSYFLRVTSSS